VIPQSVLALHPGTIKVTVEDAPQAFIATGRESDIEAFVGESKHVGLIAQASTKDAVAKEFNGNEPSIDPSNSDLWRSQIEAQLTATLKVSAEDEGAVLVASNGLAPIPQKINIVWTPTFDLTPSGIMIWVGVGLLVVAVALTLMTFRTMRINRGPRRRTPKAPKPPCFQEPAARTSSSSRVYCNYLNRTNSRLALGLRNQSIAIAIADRRRSNRASFASVAAGATHP
jgi:hypothetical protein